MLEREVTEIEKSGNLDEQKLNHLDKLMETIKNIDKCINESSGKGMSYDYRRYMSNDMSNNYSRMTPYSMNGMSGTSYDSYGRDGDNDGRYNESRDNFRNSENRGGSFQNAYGYSRDNSKKKMVQKLETLMDDTMSEHERNAIMDCIEKIK